MEMEEIVGNQIEEMCNLFRTISISEDLESLTTGESMDKQKVDALVLNEVTIGEDIDDYPDENNVISRGY